MWTPENAPRLAQQNLKDFARECRNGLVFSLRIHPSIEWGNNLQAPRGNVMSGTVPENPIYHFPQNNSAARISTTNSVEASGLLLPGEPLDSPIIGPMLVAGNIAGQAPLKLAPNLMAVYDESLINWRALEKNHDTWLSIAGTGVQAFLVDLRERAEPTNYFAQLAELGEMAVSRTLAQTAQ